MTIAGVTRELLVRYLDTWTPNALHGAKRATFAYAWSDADAGGVDTSEAALRVFAEFADLLRGRQLTYVVVAADAAEAQHRLDGVQAELRTPANLSVHALAGSPDDLLMAGLTAAGAAGGPLLVCAQVGAAPVRVANAGRPVELIAILPVGDWPGQREALSGAGFPLITGVELIDSAAGGGEQCLVGFATSRANSLEAFKNELWAVDEYAGVRYRDPHDADGHPMDISLDPHPGPLRRAILDRLTEAGPSTVTQLRHFVLTETVYRASDASKVITTLLRAGTVVSDAAHGRLSGDVVVSIASSRTG